MTSQLSDGILSAVEGIRLLDEDSGAFCSEICLKLRTGACAEGGPCNQNRGFFVRSFERKGDGDSATVGAERSSGNAKGAISAHPPEKASPNESARPVPGPSGVDLSRPGGTPPRDADRPASATGAACDRRDLSGWRLPINRDSQRNVYSPHVSVSGAPVDCRPQSTGSTGPIRPHRKTRCGSGFFDTMNRVLRYLPGLTPAAF